MLVHYSRIIILGAAIFFLNFTWLLSDTSPLEVEHKLLAQVGLVGLSAGVAPNEINTLAQELKDRESTLSVKEASLQEKEIYFTNEAKAREQKILTYAFLGGILLLGLIVLNFYTDRFIATTRTLKAS